MEQVSSRLGRLKLLRARGNAQIRKRLDICRESGAVAHENNDV